MKYRIEDEQMISFKHKAVKYFEVICILCLFELHSNKKNHSSTCLKEIKSSKFHALNILCLSSGPLIWNRGIILDWVSGHLASGFGLSVNNYFEGRQTPSHLDIKYN